MIRTMLLATAVACAAGGVNAATWRFDFGGVLGASDSFGPAGERAPLPEGTAFSFQAIFDDAVDLTGPPGPPGPPVFPALPGWTAYAPIRATMTLLGQTYDVLRHDQDGDDGVVVMLFDPTNLFNGGFWAAGIHGSPLVSDTGIIARFGSTDSNLMVDEGLLGTVYGDYIGAGYGSGPPDSPGPGDRCWPQIATATCAVEPFILFGADGTTYELAVASRPLDGTSSGLGFSASLTPVPLPATLPLLASVLAIPAIARRLRRVRPS